MNNSQPDIRHAIRRAIWTASGDWKIEASYQIADFLDKAVLFAYDGDQVSARECIKQAIAIVRPLPLSLLDPAYKVAVFIEELQDLGIGEPDEDGYDPIS